MSPRFLISPQHVTIGQELLKWANDYLMAPHAEIKRPNGDNTVCPFVRASVENNSFYMVFHDEVNGHDPNGMAEIILSYMAPFKVAEPFNEKEQIRKALLVIFPEIQEKQFRSLDYCHRLIKSDFVNNKMMIGQFHPQCQTPAVHNEAWRGVSRSPYPLMAMRHMALHDILFVGDNEDWFRKYNVEFGHRFNDPDKLDPAEKDLVKIYKKTRAKFAE